MNVTGKYRVTWGKDAGPVEEGKLFEVVAAVAAEFEREMERAVRQRDIQQATFALGGKDACHRLRNAIQHHDAAAEWQNDRDREYDQRQADKKKLRAEQRAIREADKLARSRESVPAAAPAVPSDLAARRHIETLHHQRARLLKAIDARHHQKTG